MREILFRGKRIDNGEWVYGVPVIAKDDIADKDITVMVDSPNEIVPMEGLALFEQVDPETVGQYTGLTDKNGKKIFEGDIVAIPPSMSLKSTIGVVKFGDYKTPPYGVDKTNRGFYIRWYYENEAIEEMLRRDIVFWFNYSHVDISIIGNIYDNPEMLEVEE